MNWPKWWIGIWAIALALVLFLGMQSTEGQWFFPLDDTYIHFSIGEQLARGHYGVNSDETASASSSILYPWLMALGHILGIPTWFALGINILAMGWALSWVFRTWASTIPFYLQPFAFLPLAALSLPLLGMEHGLHVWAVVGTLRGLSLPRPDLGTVIATLSLPLIRFEGFAMIVAVGAVWLWRGWFKAALGLVGWTACISIAHGLVMARFGLPFWPASVRLKSAVGLHGTDRFQQVLENLNTALQQRQGLVFIGVLLVLGILWYRRKSAVVWVALVTVAAHVFLQGRYGYFFRYEVYAVAAAWFALVSAVSGPWRPKVYVLGALLLGLPYLQAMRDTPGACRRIYEQQYQMHRWVTEFYPHPVAVNDLGWVSYKNDLPVLDLMGLGNEKVCALRTSGQFDTSHMEALANDYGVHMALIFTEWFDEIGLPSSWKKVGSLRTYVFTGPGYLVDFYTTPLADEAEVREALEAFQASLPNP